MEDIPVANVVTEEEDARAVYDVVKSGWISKGKKVDEFEKKFAQSVQARHAVAVNSGTSALHTVLAALGVGPRDEVLLPSLTFISTANVVLYQGATPVLMECSPETFNVTPDIIEAAITSKTRAIIPVDMNGMPVDYDAILALGKHYDIPIIADSAESLGAIYKGQPVGGVADIHCFSFFPNKGIATGEGGMITTSDVELADRMRMILNQGQDGRYNHVMLGYNYRMNDILAALGIVQLGRLEKIMKEKENIVAQYTDQLQGVEGVQLPYLPDYVDRHSWYMYAIKVDQEIRDSVAEHLKKNNVDTRLSFPPIHIQQFFQDRFGYNSENLPASYKTWKRLINLPIWPGLTMHQIEYVSEKVVEAIHQFG